MLGGMNSTEKRTPLAGIPRRELLAWMWLLAASAAAIKATDLTYTFVRASRATQQPTRFDAGTVAEFLASGEAPLPFPEGGFWLAQTQEGAAALDGVCTHLDCLLGWDDQSHQFICPCHGSRFDATGRHVAGPAPRAMDRFAVEVVDGEGVVVAATDFGVGSTAVPVAAIPQETAATLYLVVDISQETAGTPAT